MKHKMIKQNIREQSRDEHNGTKQSKTEHIAEKKNRTEQRRIGQIRAEPGKADQH